MCFAFVGISRPTWASWLTARGITIFYITLFSGGRTQVALADPFGGHGLLQRRAEHQSQSAIAIAFCDRILRFMRSSGALEDLLHAVT
jgi:hypothetical protein